MWLLALRGLRCDDSSGLALRKTGVHMLPEWRQGKPSVCCIFSLARLYHLCGRRKSSRNAFLIVHIYMFLNILGWRLISFVDLFLYVFTTDVACVVLSFPGRGVRTWAWGAGWARLQDQVAATVTLPETIVVTWNTACRRRGTPLSFRGHVSCNHVCWMGYGWLWDWPQSRVNGSWKITKHWSCLCTSSCGVQATSFRSISLTSDLSWGWLTAGSKAIGPASTPWNVLSLLWPTCDRGVNDCL